MGSGLQGLESEGATSTQVQRQPIEALQSLPDAPSAQVLLQADKLQWVSEEARLPVTVGKVGMNVSVMRGTDAVPLAATVPANTDAQKRATDFFSKYLDPSRKQSLRYQPSSSNGLMGRATDAASRIFVSRDESGKRRLNTSYFLRVLTSVAADSASRRYRARSGSAPLSDFGSTVGNDAGRNLLREFGPGIRQMVTGHMPEFVSRMRLIRQQKPQ